MGLRQKLLATVLQDLPTPSSVLEEGSSRYDELLGGRRGPGQWGRFSSGHGTTCIVTLDGWMISAGFPDDMVVTTDTPTGGGTPILRALYAGSDKRGWTRIPQRGVLPDLRPGDIYISDHTTSDGSDGTHVGAVLAVRVAADGKSMEVDTGDGGQGTREHQTMGRRTRTFKLSDDPHPVVIDTPGVGPSWLQRWIAVGGDTPDDEVVALAPAAAARNFVPIALAAAGIAAIAGGVYLYLAEAGRGAANAVREPSAVDRALASWYATHGAQPRDISFWHLVDEGLLTSDGRLTDQGVLPRERPRLPEEFEPIEYGLLGTMRDAQDVTVNFEPRGDNSDLDRRRKFERLAEKAGFEVTGAGTAFNAQRQITGTDVDVRCAGVCDEDLLRDLAGRVGLTVADVRGWNS